jgi:ergothioneine biosynthesis protein EgtB
MTERLLAEHSDIVDVYSTTRALSETLASVYTEADQTVQSMPDASPVKWHLAHTSWFFETFLLKPNVPGYQVYHPQFEYLFNSYYNSVGEQFSRPNRGLITRPGKHEVLDYRRYIDEHMLAFLTSPEFENSEAHAALVMLGLAHEQQHQELLVTDIQHAMSINPLRPVFTAQAPLHPEPESLEWLPLEEGLYEIGSDSQTFVFDNETPKHRVFVHACSAANRLTTNAEFIAFMEAGGYKDPLLWLSEGWAWKNAQGIEAPLYWTKRNGQWWHYSLGGFQPVDLNAPVTHISYFEANAYAAWANARLLTEFEWEILAQRHAEFQAEQRYNSNILAPTALGKKPSDQQWFNVLWQWTASQYLPYPGFDVADGAVGEYNGKFMSNQFVLRGGSCATPPNHIRPTYRNFFPATTRWQFSGIRIARDD